MDQKTINTAKWFLILDLYGELDMSFVESVLSQDNLSTKQLISLGKCAIWLHMEQKIGKFDTSRSVPYLSGEFVFDETSICSATNKLLVDVNVIVCGEKLFSVDAWKKRHTRNYNRRLRQYV